jgi:hypothetical protein
MLRTLILVATHLGFAVAGFAAGIYVLPIWIEPAAPTEEQIEAIASTMRFTGEFRRDLSDSDGLHWGEGVVSVGPAYISHVGQLAPGPDYKLYLSPFFVETEKEFLQRKAQMVRIGDVATFSNFVVPVPPEIDPADYTSVIIWCETFSQFITAARYRSDAE